MSEKYRKFKLSDNMTQEEIDIFKETQFYFDPCLFGAYVLCDSKTYSELPQNCKPATIPISFKNGEYRADGVADCFINKNDEAYVSESEMEACICIEWPL
jgi:hypothetical protein